MEAGSKLRFSWGPAATIFLKGISEYSNARIAVIGGLALWKYIPTGRTTEVFDSHILSGRTSNLHGS